MENRAHALAAGLFVLLLGLAAGAGLWWLGQRQEAVDYYILETRGNVAGLNDQATVRYRGIRAGRVEDITTDARDPRIIVVTISLDSRYKLTRGSRARLSTQGLTGLAYVQLADDGSDVTPLAARDGQLPRLPLEASLIDTLGDQAGETVARVSEVAARLALLLDERNLNHVARSLEGLAAAGEGLKELPALLASLRQVLSESNLRRLASTLDNLEKTSRETAPLVQDLRHSVVAVGTLAEHLDHLAAAGGGELTGDTLPKANALIAELTVSVRQMRRVLETLEQEPQSLVFGRNSTAPGPGEPGFTPPAR